MSLAFTAFHSVRSLARERLGLSCGLRGNGMAFARTLLEAVPYRAFSIVEDLEYGIALGRAGFRVHYVPEATVAGDMCSSERNSRSQRQRWENGRSTIAKHHVGSLLIDALRRRDWVLFDLGVDLLIPPLAQLVSLIVAGVLLCMLASVFDRSMKVAPWFWGLSMIGVGLHLTRACALSGAGARVLLDLLYVPAYILWKLTLPFTSDRLRRNDWVRTSRERQT